MKKNIFTETVEKRLKDKNERTDVNQANTPDIETIKETSRMAGAIGAWNVNRITSMILIVETLEKAKEQKKHLKMGYATFGELCEREFNISKSTAYEWLKLSKNLGIEALKALGHIGLNQKALKELGAAKKEDEIEIVEADVPTLKYDDMEIELVPENANTIQDIINHIKEIKEQNELIKTQLEETKRLLTNTEVLEICQRKEIEILEFFKPLIDIKERAQDPSSRKALIPTIIKIETFVQEIKNELLTGIE